MLSNKCSPGEPRLNSLRLHAVTHLIGLKLDRLERITLKSWVASWTYSRFSQFDLISLFFFTNYDNLKYFFNFSELLALICEKAILMFTLALWRWERNIYKFCTSLPNTLSITYQLDQWFCHNYIWLINIVRDLKKEFKFFFWISPCPENFSSNYNSVPTKSLIGVTLSPGRF